MIYEGVGGYGKIKIKENGMTLINIKKLKNVIISVQSCSQVPAEYFMEIFHYKTHRSVAGWVGLKNMFIWTAIFLIKYFQSSPLVIITSAWIWTVSLIYVMQVTPLAARRQVGGSPLVINPGKRAMDSSNIFIANKSISSPFSPGTRSRSPETHRRCRVTLETCILMNGSELGSSVWCRQPRLDLLYLQI